MFLFLSFFFVSLLEQWFVLSHTPKEVWCWCIVCQNWLRVVITPGNSGRESRSRLATLKWRSLKICLPGWSSTRGDLKRFRVGLILMSFTVVLVFTLPCSLLCRLPCGKSCTDCFCLLKDTDNCFHLKNIYIYKCYHWYFYGVWKSFCVNSLILLLLIHNNYHCLISNSCRTKSVATNPTVSKTSVSTAVRRDETRSDMEWIEMSHSVVSGDVHNWILMQPWCNASRMSVSLVSLRTISTHKHKNDGDGGL